MLCTHVSYSAAKLHVILIPTIHIVVQATPSRKEDMASHETTILIMLSALFCCNVVQSVDFVGYHVRRTTAAVLCHLLLPLAYCAGLGLVQPDWEMVSV